MKKQLLTLAISFALPLAVFAGATDVTLGAGSAILSVGGYSLSVVGTSAVVQSVTVSSASFSAVLLPGSQIAVSSATGQKLATDAAEANITGNQCVSGVSTLTLSASSGSAVTVTVTPSASTCVGTATNSSSAGNGGGGSPGGGGGGGGGSTYITPAKPATPATPAVPGVSSAVSATPATPATPALPAITKVLSKGSTGIDVLVLQKILNRDMATRVAASGAGSPGNETMLLGPATVKAIQKFQEKYGIAKKGDSGYGLVGPKTRAKLNEIGKGTSSMSAPKSVTPSSSTPSSASAVSDIAKQLNDSLKLLKELQEKLKTVK